MGESPERVLYWFSGSPPAWRALIALHEKGLSFQNKQLEMSKGEHKGPEVMAINPRGQVPAFKDGDTAVNESMAIIQYLDAVYPDPPLTPKEGPLLGKTLQRFHEVTGLHSKFGEAIGIKFMGKGTPEEEEAFKGKVAKLKEELGIWNEYFEEAAYAAGPSFTIADIAIAPFLFIAERFGATFTDLPNIRSYMDKVKTRPSIAETWPPHWKEGPPTHNFFGGPL